jgi:hypothetical protein
MVSYLRICFTKGVNQLNLQIQGIQRIQGIQGTEAGLNLGKQPRHPGEPAADFAVLLFSAQLPAGWAALTWLETDGGHHAVNMKAALLFVMFVVLDWPSSSRFIKCLL